MDLDVPLDMEQHDAGCVEEYNIRQMKTSILGSRFFNINILPDHHLIKPQILSNTYFR